jgi:DNA processing protein
MEDPALFQLALARINGIGPVYTKMLIGHFGDAPSVFRAGRSELEHTRLPDHLIAAILELTDYSGLQKELLHLHDIGARILFFTDPDYPSRLLHLPGAPALLFYQGAANLNAEKVIAIAGTRQPTKYGKEATANLIRELARPDLLIISGLAFGIDFIAHRTAMQHKLPTIGVLGHGFDHLYPAEHAGLARNMCRDGGGLLTSFFHETGPEYHTFPLRNQLVAGLCDALLVIESGVEGGSLSAAKAALAFGKKVFALPGRTIDAKSLGCLQLIHQHEALPLLSARQLSAAMSWAWSSGHDSHQPALPFSSAESGMPDESDIPQSNSETDIPQSQPDPEDDARPLLDAQLIGLLQQPLTFEDLITLTRQPAPAISSALLDLELNGLIRCLPGRRYLVAS